ncbi:MAG: MBG domain-containing protein [Gaiellaceae bacterium]
MSFRRAGLPVALAAGVLAIFGMVFVGGGSAAHREAGGWAARGLKGGVTLKGQIPKAAAQHRGRAVAHHAAGDELSLSFAFPLRDKAGLDRLILQEATTHNYLSRAQIYARFAPPAAQVKALRRWLVAKGFRITHVGADRMAIGAAASTSTVEKALHVKIDDFVKSAFTFRGVKVKPYRYYANTKAPTVPARLGLQSISGLSNVDRFFTNAQIYAAQHPHACNDDDNATINPLCVDVRSGGYFPIDLQGLYDITGHGYDATGQTVGFTLWTTPERQAAMTAYASLTGDTPITVDPSCPATGNSPTTPSSCSTVQVQPDHLLTILENGNSDSNANFGSNVETALDIEAAHGVATHAALKYYADGCAPNPEPGSGLSNAGCNGSDVGMEEAMEDAANDPTLHSVSNSWGYGGEAEWGLADPFMIATNNTLALAAAVGTSFYFSTGDAGTYQSGWPTDSQYVVSVGGTSLYSTSNSAHWSTSVEWSGSGSWCSNIVTRPSWQTAPGLAAASCPGRVSPDVSADADPNTGVRFIRSSNLTGGVAAGQVGGTSLSAPIMNGLQALTQNFVDAQTYSGPTPEVGFESPVLYQLGNSGHADSYFRDIQCGNTANPTSGPDGDAAAAGWDPGSGWGEPDWYQFSIGYALQLGATNLSVPPSLAPHVRWSFAKTPSNSTERSISCPTVSTCYAVGSPSGGTPWYGKFLPGGAWGAVNTFFKSKDGGQSWFPSNSDMFSIGCTSSSTCLEVGAGGRERRTTDGGSTWSDVATAPGNNKPLTRVQCPSSSICYAAGDRGNVMKSTDGGQTWSWLSSTGANPIYGLSCPTTSVCYAADIYAHVLKTADGGTTWTWQSTPITTPGADQVAETGGPNPYAGLLSISCSSATTCVASGLYVVPTNAGQSLPSADPPIVTTTDGGAHWVRQTSNGGVTPTGTTTTLSAAAAVGATNIKVGSVNGRVVGESITVDSTGANPEKVTIMNVGTAGAAGTGLDITPALTFAHASGVTVAINAPNYLHSVSCLPGTMTCWAVGRNGAIVTTTDLATWTAQTSNTTNLLNSVTCLSTSFCIAVGQNGTVDIYNGTIWTATTGNGGTGTLASVYCVDASTCYAAGKQGVTIATSDGGAHWAQQAGGGTTQQMNGVSCPSADACYAVGNAGTILKTSNGGQTWASQTSGTANALNSIACTSMTACAAVGAAGTARYTTDGSTWTAGTTGITTPLSGVACSSASACTAVGGTPATINAVTGNVTAAATSTIVTSGDGGATWSSATDPVSNANLNAAACASTTCYAVGAQASTVGSPLSGNAVLLKSTDSGTTWAPQTSGAASTLNGIACVNSANCFADGTFGTVIATNDGSTWTQQGNPMSGPTTALNATNIALNGAACTTARCLIGLGVQGDILDTPLLTVTVNASGTYGSTPNLSGLAPGDSAISYDPSGEAANVTGTLTCSTTAVDSSPVGSYPISNCSGPADEGFNVVYDYADSSYDVTKAPLTVTADNKTRLFGAANPALTATLSGFVLGQTLATSGVTGKAACTTTAMTFSPGGPYPITCTQGTLDAANYSFGPFVPGTLTVTYTGACITGVVNGRLTVGAGRAICLGPGAKATDGVTVSGGSLDVEGATIEGGLRSTGAAVLRICGSTTSGGLRVSGSTDLVLVGGDAATGACDGNTITGAVTITDSTGGVEFNGNHVFGGLTITGITGTLPPPDFGPVHATGNTVTGKVNVQS